MSKYVCNKCGEDLKDGEDFEIKTMGRISRIAKTTFFSETKVYICKDCNCG